jgi:hypothetical protein
MKFTNTYCYPKPGKQANKQANKQQVVVIPFSPRDLDQTVIRLRTIHIQRKQKISVPKDRRQSSCKYA